MWSWLRSEFLIPKITRWEGYTKDKILPLVQHPNHFCTKHLQIQGHECASYKALSKNGIKDLCVYCKNSLKRFSDLNLKCKFSYDIGSESFGWDDSDIALLCEGIEIPAIALFGYNIQFGFPSKKHFDKISFNLQRIKNNIKMMQGNITIYCAVKNDPSTNFFASRTITPRAHSMDAWFIRLRKLHEVLKEIDTDDPRLLTLEI